MVHEDSVSEIKIFLDDLRNAVIGFENYKKYFDKVKNTDMVISTQIGKLSDDLKNYKNKYAEYTNKEYFRNNYDDGIVQVDVYELIKDMNNCTMEAYTWKSLQEEMYNIIFMKIYSVLDDARALDIKRDALKEMREMDNEKQEMFIKVFENMSNMFKEAVLTKLENYDEKIFNLILMNDEEHRKDRRDMYNFFTKTLSKLGLKENADEILEDVDMNYEPKADKIYKKSKEEKKISNRKTEFDNLYPDEDEDEDDGNDDIRRKFNKKEKVEFKDIGDED